MGAYVQEVRQDDNSQNLLFKIGRFLAAATTGYSSLSVSSTPKQSANPPSNNSIQTGAGVVFTLAAGEIGFIRQLNTTNPLFYLLGTGASSTNFSDVLAAGTATDNGTGAATVIDDYIGPVSVAGTTLRYISWKRAL
jgi:hypothetical protein